MPINPDVQRYADLLNQIPEGTFYDQDGIVVPYRSGPYELRFTTDTPSQKFGLFRNGEYLGLVASDALGNLVVSVQLVLGENVVQVVHADTKETTQALLTCRNYATWMAAWAEELEKIDDQIDTVRLDAALATCFDLDLTEIWGRRLDFARPNGWDTPAYRDGLQIVHQARRLFGAKVHGHEAAVEAVCQVPPLDWFRRFDGKRWLLGWNVLDNGTFAARAHSFVPAPTISGIVVVAIGALATPGAGSLAWNVGLQQITYTDPTLGAFSVVLTPNLDGTYAIGGPAYPAAKVGLPGPYLIVAGFNDTLSLSLDHRGRIDIVLPPGGAQTVGVLAAAINAALLVDPRYGLGYVAVAGGFGASPRLRVTSPVSGLTSELVFFHHPQSALATVFGLNPTDTPAAILGYQEPILTVAVTRAQLPLANTVANFTVHRTAWVDGWLLSAGTLALSTAVPQQSEFTWTVLDITTDGTNEAILWREVALDELEPYRGFPLRVGVWLTSLAPGVNLYVRWSFDGGVTWLESPVIPLANQDDPYERPQYVSASFVFDPDATSLRVGLRIDAGAPGVVVSLHEIRLDQPYVTAAFLALDNTTLPRNRHRSFFGHLLWAWCPDPLAADENEVAGFGTPPAWPVGVLDTVGAAHTQIDRFNVTELEVPSGIAKNLKGAVTEADWASVQLTNLALVPRLPSRFSHAAPTVAGDLTTDPLVFPSIAPFQATLAVESDQNPATSVLFEGVVPLPQDQWSYVNGTTVQVAAPSFNPAAVYTLRYRALYRAVSEVIDLGPAWADYVWFFDWSLYQRFSTDVDEVPQEIVLLVDFSTYTATLDRPANPDDLTAVVTRNDGAEAFELPRDSWTFTTAQTISFAGEVIKTGSIYRLRYLERRMRNAPVISVVAEERAGVDVASTLAAAWKPADRNSAVKTDDGLRFHQFRLTLRGVEDVRDLRLSSVVWKGLNLFGLGGVIPGLRP
jgi:hypothetical protein